MIHIHKWYTYAAGRIEGYDSRLKACKRCTRYKLIIETLTMGYIPVKYKNLASVPDYVMKRMR